MTAPLHDGDLASSYAREGSESAFRALVARHISLVFATAFRQVGDAGIAEEITQNVFVSLARKAPALGKFQTLAGWLHRTTILEAKARLRHELRRRQREQAAAELAALRAEGAAHVEALLPLLDEALLALREKDRLALITRFIEDRPLREVGALLGVDEDAARKRVSRALERLAAFFRQRGFALPGTAGLAALFSSGSQAAPAAVAAGAAQAGLAAGAGGGAASAWMLFLMNFKAKTALVCALAVTAPLLWQGQVQGDVEARHAALLGQIESRQNQLAALDRNRNELREQLRAATRSRFAEQARAAALRAQRQGRAPSPKYQWNDAIPVARLPKEFVKEMREVEATQRSGELIPEMKELLQMSPREAAETQNAFTRYLAGIHAAQAQGIHPVEPTEKDLMGRNPEEIRSFEIPGIEAEGKALRDELFANLNSILGPERFEIMRQALRRWMPIEDGGRGGLNTGMAVFERPHKIQFYQPQPGSGRIERCFRAEHSLMNASLQIDEIPSFFHPYIQDWIQLAQTPPPEARPH